MGVMPVKGDYTIFNAESKVFCMTPPVRKAIAVAPDIIAR